MTQAAPPERSEPAVPAPLEQHRRVRSYVVRAGRTTAGQQQAIERLGSQYVLSYAPTPLDLVASFGNAAPVVLEIGFGMGDATAAIARDRPDENFLCCEVHTPGVGALLKHIDEMGLKNIRIVQHDAVEILQHMLPHSSLAGAHVFFPDPWHKKRHHKRRLIQAAFVDLLVQRLLPGGYLHAATDWQEYAEQMVQVLQANAWLENTSRRADGFSERPWYRPVTKFEKRGLRLGHGVWDVLFHKRPGAPVSA